MHRILLHATRIAGVSVALAACDAPPVAPRDTALVPAPSTARWADLGRECKADAPATLLSAAARDSLPKRSSRDMNDEMADLARDLPGGWGGMFLDQGVMTVYLTDPSQKAAFVSAAQGRLPVGPDSRVIQGRWDFAQLYDWYRYIGRVVWFERSFT